MASSSEEAASAAAAPAPHQKVSGEEPPQSDVQSPADELINVRINTQDERKVFFKINRKKPLEKMLIAFCERELFEYKAVRFLFEGQHFCHRKTPDEIGMEEGDEIDAMQEQLGGA